MFTRSHTGSPNHDTTESLPYTFSEGMSQALDVFVAKSDPKQAKARSKDSSGGRKRRNIINALPDISLLEELVRRQRIDERRIWRRKYMRDYRAAGRGNGSAT